MLIVWLKLKMVLLRFLVFVVLRIIGILFVFVIFLILQQKIFLNKYFRIIFVFFILQIFYCFILIVVFCLSFGIYVVEWDVLFGDDLFIEFLKLVGCGFGIKGFVQFELVCIMVLFDYWFKMCMCVDLSSQGSLGDGLKWKLGVCFDYDVVYGINDYYNFDVEKN